MLVHDYLEVYARNMPGLACLTSTSATYTYSEVEKLSNQMAHGLRALGLNAAQRIGILGENSLEHLIVFMAASKIGAVAVSINYRLAPPEIAYIVEDSDMQVLVVTPDQQDNLENFRQDLPSYTKLVTASAPESLHWDTWLANHPQLPYQPGDEIDPEAGYLQLYTSGTTGNPKGVVISHKNILSLAAMNAVAAPFKPNIGDGSIICAPLFHIGGVGSLLINIRAGMHTLLHREFNPLNVVKDMENNKVTSIFMVPAMIMAILNLPDIERRDFSKLDQIYYGASPISESVLARAIDVFKCQFVQMYGMTETTGTVINLSAQDHERAMSGKPELLRSCGRPSVGVKVKIMDMNAKEVPTGNVGEIWVKSDTNMTSYYNLPEATRANLTDGWIHTGDAGYMDAEGYIYLKDRIKDMVVSGSENIYPVEVENVIAKHAAVIDVAVIGIPDEKFGERLLAILVLKDGHTLTIDALITFCRKQIAGYKIPRQMEVVETLPRNPSGKILKKILRQPYWEGRNREIG